MAKEDLLFKVGIDPDGSGGKSLSDLKKAFRELQAEVSKANVGTKEYSDALQALGYVKDEIGDLRDTINALNPEGKVQAFANVAGKLAGGFQAATGAAALFGVQSEELEKQLLKVQAATALAQGIQSVVGLTDAFKVLGAVIAANPIMFLSAAILGIVAATVALMKATDEYTNSQERLNQELEQYNKLLKTSQENEDYRIRQLKINGSTEEEILKARIESAEEQFLHAQDLAKKQLEILNNSNEDEKKANYDKYIELFTQLGDYDLKVKEARKALADFNVSESKKEADRINKNNEDAAIRAAKINTDFYKQQVKDKQTYEDVIFGIEAMSWDENIYPLKVKKAEQEIKLAKQTEEKKNEFRKAAEAELEKRAAARADAEVRINENYFNAISDLSATYFNAQLASVRGNVAEEEKIRKKQFQVNKAFSAVKATMDGINAVQGVLAQSLLYGPATIPLAVSMGLAAAANVAKILSQQYQSPQTNTGQLNISAGDAPQIQTSAPNTGAVPLTRLNEQGQNLSAPVRAYVVETDVSESQERVRRIQEQNTF